MGGPVNLVKHVTQPEFILNGHQIFEERTCLKICSQPQKQTSISKKLQRPPTKSYQLRVAHNIKRTQIPDPLLDVGFSRFPSYLSVA